MRGPPGSIVRDVVVVGRLASLLPEQTLLPGSPKTLQFLFELLNPLL